MFISELLTALIGRNTIYQRWKTNSELIDIARCKPSKNVTLDIETQLWSDTINKLQEPEAWIILLKDPLGDLLKTGPIQTGWGYTIES
jgi:hypothetical protein